MPGALAPWHPGPAMVPAGRPRVLVNCATSLDGKLQLAPALRARAFAMSRGPEDHRRMRALRGRADAVIIGGQNLRVDDPDLALLDDERTRRRATGMREPLRVVVTRAAEGIDPAHRIFDATRGGESVVAHTAALREERRAALSRVATLLDLGRSTPAPDAGFGAPADSHTEVDVRRLLGWLADQRACRTVLVEGGGLINASFFAARAVDELFVTVVPRILGGATAPTLVDGGGFADDQVPDAHLAELERIGDELFLRYRFEWP
ncbi:MAG: dihydrofolate reductase family protein [Polyangiaceae bacterium]